MVDLGKTKILKGQVAQAFDGFVRGDALFSDLIEELAKGLGIHGGSVIVDCRGNARGLWLRKVVQDQVLSVTYADYFSGSTSFG